MRVFQINAVPYGSTGRIMVQIAQLLEQQGHKSLCTTGFTWEKCTYDKHFITSGLVAKNWHTIMARLTGLNGCFSVIATRRLLRRIDAFKPDVIHLHNLHCWYVNLPMLFGYIKKHDIPVVWTFHDCWPITGHCPHFASVGCDRWKTGCHSCPIYRRYPQCLFDDSKAMWHRKKKWFTGVKNLTVVTPSHWLADLVKQSFLRDYPVQVIHNGIDLDVFRPTEGDFRRQHGCQDKFLLLGVAFDWNNAKGLDVFIELSKRLPKGFQIVLVGTNEDTDKLLPKNIISVHRTASTQELAGIYTAADLLVNPTREEVFGLVNAEALACGTPVLTFNTGGSPEVPDEACGSVVATDDIDALEREILRIAQDAPFSQDACLRRARAFHKNARFEEYIALYQKLTKDVHSQPETPACRRVFQINAVPYGSTGRIMVQIARLLEQQGHEAQCTTGFTWEKCTYEKHFITSGLVEKTWHTYMARFTGFNGCFSVMATRRLLRRINAFKPDVIHLHNLHCWYVNLPMLFRFLKKHDIPVVWTFHDCWAITGHCPHFAAAGCDKWKTGCHGCPLYRQYPQCLFDNSKAMWHRKKRWFTGVKNLTVVTPSQWLAGVVKQSYLQDYPVKVIHNGIDLNIFRPLEGDFRQRYGCQDKFLLLGVAFDWNRSKGPDVFIELSKRLPRQFQIVLVGTNEELDKTLPASIISIHRTASAQALAEIYTAADLFVNPTREDTFPTVNMEALACGTPVLTFNTGGSPEIPDETCGSVVAADDIDGLEQEILRIAQQTPFSQEACLHRAAAFNKDDRFEEYVSLYQQLMGNHGSVS